MSITREREDALRAGSSVLFLSPPHVSPYHCCWFLLTRGHDRHGQVEQCDGGCFFVDYKNNSRKETLNAALGELFFLKDTSSHHRVDGRPLLNCDKRGMVPLVLGCLLLQYGGVPRQGQSDPGEPLSD